MNVFLNVLAPVFGIAALGFLAARFHVLRASGVDGLVTFVFDFGIPVLLFRSLARIELPSHIEWGFLAAFYGGSFTTFGLGVAAGRVLFRTPLDQAAIFGMSAAFCNTVFMGIPVILMALGPEATFPLFLIIAFHGPTLMPLTVGLLHLGRGTGVSPREQVRSVARALAANPIIAGLTLGMLANAARLTIPAPVDRMAELLGTSAVPCALFAMGASIPAFALAGHVRPALVLTLLKLVIHPALVWALGRFALGLHGIWLDVAVVMAAMPTGVNAYLFGARYDAAPDVAARTVLLASVLCVLTLPVFLLLLGR